MTEQERGLVNQIVKAVPFRYLLFCLSLALIARYLNSIGATTIGMILAGVALGIWLTTIWFGYHD